MRMKLGHRNLFYSIILAGIILLFIIGYFVYMLPSLYVEYTMAQNLKAIKIQHRAYVENGNYNNIQVRNPTACYSIEIPDGENRILITGKLLSAELTLKDERLITVFEEIYGMIKDFQSTTDKPDYKKSEKQIQEKLKKWETILREAFTDEVSLPVDIELIKNEYFANGENSGYQNTYFISDNFFVIESGIKNNDISYSNYIALEKTKNSLIISLLPVVTPDMNEIRPIVLQSIPMLIVVILLLVLLFSQVYSKGIVTPIVQLVGHTQRMKQNSSFRILPMEKKLKNRKDEIGTLTATIEGLYYKIKENYEKLEEEIQRQEILLRASSHQLKTPISAALLLSDGMIHKIGKYKETDKYLPKVKEELLSMRKIVEDILYLNHSCENLEFQNIEIIKLIENQLSSYRIAIADKQINICLEAQRTVKVMTDETIFSRIFDNLLSNAVNYTPERETIKIIVKTDELVIQNFGVQIDHDILPHIFDAFVSGRHEQKDSEKRHGLGLYIASYYARKAGIKIEVYNDKNSVTAALHFPKSKHQ